MKYPDEYIEFHVGLFLNEIVIYNSNDDNSKEYLHFQIGVNMQFDICPIRI